MPVPIHARPIRARYDRFMPIPIHAQNCSCPHMTYSCQHRFMPASALFMPYPFHAEYDLFMPVPIHAWTIHAKNDLFMPIPIHARVVISRIFKRKKTYLYLT